MTCVGRFKAIDDKGLPAITNYDYPENIPIRGINNRSFRWEEVSSEAPYHFLQTGTVNPELNITGYTLDVELTGPVVAGGRLILDNVCPSGWRVSGYMTFRAGATGFNLTQNLYGSYGLNSGMWVNSIQGDSIFLYDINAGGFGDLFAPRLEQTGIQLLTGQRWQFYMQAKGVCITDSTGEVNINYNPNYGVRPYIVGLNSSNAPICYWNANSGVWLTSEPTGSLFRLEENRITDIKFDFNTYNALFPAGIPAKYNVVVRTPGPGVGIVVDNVFTDMYASRNPFSEVYVPTGYILQLTPDLGWHDTVALFGDRESITNPHLKTLGPYLVSQNTLQDNSDGTVTLSLTSGDFQNNLNSKYSKYLWRVVAVNEYLQYGSPGFPKRFFYIGGDIENKFYIEQVFDDPISLIKVIIGKRSNRMLVETDTDVATIEYPTSDSWKCTVILTSPTLKLGIRGVDRGGAFTKWHYVDLSTQGLPQVERALWNVFDEHGLLVDLKRLPSESNQDYKDRIKDILRSPAGASYRGVVNGGCRELGLEKIEDAITTQVYKRSIGSYDAPSASIEVTSTCIKIRTPSMVRTEYKLLDPVLLNCELDKMPASEPKLVETVEGIRVPDDKISLDTEDGENPDSRKIRVDDQSLGGRVIKVVYEYYEVCWLSTHTKLCNVVDFLNLEALNEAGQPMVEAILNFKLSGGEDSRGLFISSHTIVPGSTTSLGWSPLILRRISDRSFRESFRSEDQSYWQTKFVEYSNELKSKTNIEWGSVVADKDRWDAANNEQMSFDHLPTLMDPELTRYRTYNITGDTFIILDASDVQWRGGSGNSGELLGNRGFSSTDFHPGIGFTEDLRPNIFVGRKALAPVTDGFEIVGEKVPNNFIQLFSGIF